jgi:hypothetical protein
VTFSSCAARVKLKCLPALSKAYKDFRGGKLFILIFLN